jgi:anti-sigma-K factor RskA
MNGRDHDRDHERWQDDAAAYALGALDPAETAEFERHLEGCERCQAGIRWLMPAVNALPEAAEPAKPSASLRASILGEVRRDAAEHARAVGTAHGAEAGGWRRRLGNLLGGSGSRPIGLRPLAGLAAIALVAVVAGYAIGTGGSEESGGGSTIVSRENGITVKMVGEGDSGTLQLANVPQLPDDRVLEAWVQRDGEVEAVRALFVPDRQGRASTQLPDMTGVEVVMVTSEPKGGSEAPTSSPIVTLSVPG